MTYLKLINTSQRKKKRNFKCLMRVFISDKDMAKLCKRPIFLDQNNPNLNISARVS